MRYNILFSILLFIVASCTSVNHDSQISETQFPVQGTSSTLQDPIISTGGAPPIEVISTGSADNSGVSFTGVLEVGSGKIDPLPQVISGEMQPQGGKDICIQDLCIRAKNPYFLAGDEYIQISYMTGENADKWEYLHTIPSKNSEGNYELDFESSREVHIKKDRKSGKLIENQIMFQKVTEYSEVDSGVYLVKERSGGCGGSSIKQKFLDARGKSVKFDKLGKVYPKKLQVGNISFSSYWTEESVSYLWYRIGLDGLNEIEETFSINDDVGSKLLARMKEKREFTHAYAIKYKEFPGIVFFYQSNLSNAERIISLGNDGKWKKDNLDSNGNLLNLDLSKKILGYYESQGSESPLIPGGKQVQRKGDTQYDKVSATEVTSDMLPIFRVIPLDTSGDYLLYPAKGFESVTMAELCKPLVYVYDKQSRNNSLSVGFPQGGVFTKILPSFTRGNTWDFLANNDSIIQLPGETNTYDYLYYSAKVPNYTYNQNGWQVYGKDIEKLFEEKLDYIGLNQSEKKDFIEYWVPEFKKDILYFVSFKFDDDLNTYVTLRFGVKPITQMRVLLEAYPIEVAPQNAYLWPNVGTRFDSLLLKKFIRSGVYDVFEWGGTIQKVPGGNFYIH